MTAIVVRRRRDGVGFLREKKYFNLFYPIERKKRRENLANISKVPLLKNIGNTRVKR